MQTGEEREAPATDAGARKGRRASLFARARVVAVVLLVLLGLGLAADWLTASPQVCTSCHEMSVRAGSWEVSAHAGVRCVSCHQPAHPWYAFPATLADRAGLLSRDVVAHFTENLVSPVDTRSADVEPMPDSVCLQCHDPNRKATSGFRIRIDHPEHAKRNGSCISCHVRTAHPLPGRGTPLSLMAQCFTCHGTADKPKAGTACTLCHPTGYELRPESHAAATWQKRHGEVAIADAPQCRLCHEEQFCTDCHGVAMPHPDSWAQPGESDHAQYAEKDRSVCAKCHVEKPDLCSMCHHKAWNPGKGTWVQQHFLEVGEKGADFCMQCHAPVYCVRCHVSFAIQN